MLEHKVIQAKNEHLASFAASEITGLCLHFKEYLLFLSPALYGNQECKAA